MAAAMSIEQDLSAYIAAAVDMPIPASVEERARCHLLDTLAAIVSGRFLPAGQFGYRFVGELGAVGPATLLGSEQTSSVEYAAFANAMAAHADETDDSHVGGRFHPGCAIIPAALAVAEQTDADSDAILRAIALGYDVGARSTMALGFKSPSTTKLSTHSIGALFGAAASAGALMRLTPPEAEALLSFTVQQASGLSYWNRDPDHVEKSFDFGAKAARNGVFSAMLAKAGMTAPDAPLTGKNGYLDAFAETAKPEALSSDLGTRYEIELASIKKWSVGSPIQSVLDAVEALFDGQPVAVEDVGSVVVDMPSDRIQVIDDRDMPAVCAQHLVALALQHGRVTFAASHDQNLMTAPEILAWREKIRLEPSDALAKARPERQSIVTVTMRDGSTRRHHAKVVRGTRDDRMPPREVAVKASDILSPLFADGGASLIALCLEGRCQATSLALACRLPRLVEPTDKAVGL